MNNGSSPNIWAGKNRGRCGKCSRFDFQLHSSISRWNSIGNFTDGRLVRRRGGRETRVWRDNKLFVPFNEAWWKVQVHSRPRIFRASISIILVWSINCSYPLQRGKFRMGWIESGSLCFVCNERKRNWIWIRSESFGIYNVCFLINANGNGAVRRIIWDVNLIRNIWWKIII